MMPRSFRLTKMEEMLLAFLFVQSRPTKPMMMDFLYAGQVNEPEMKILDVMVSKMRKKLSPFGIEISTYWGRGYYLDPEVKEQIKAHMAAQAERMDLGA